MKKNIFGITTLFFTGFISCNIDHDLPTMLTAYGFNKTIAENPGNGILLGTITGKTTKGSVNFSFSSQTPEGAFAIDSKSGKLTIRDKELFNYEVHQKLEATVKVSNGIESKEANVSIRLTDVKEVLSDDMTKTIAENPKKGMLLETIKTSGNQKGVIFSIVSQNPENAFALDKASGELTVADPALFDFEVGMYYEPTVKIKVIHPGEEKEITFSVRLTDVAEIEFKAGSFNPIIAENPETGQTLVDLGSEVITNGPGTTTFSIVDQNPANALAMDEKSKKIIVSDTTPFNFEAGEANWPKATIKVTHGEAEKEIAVAVRLSNSKEVDVLISTLAGSGASGSKDGTGEEASFDKPMGIATDANSNVYVADPWNNNIRKITPNGVVTTLAGSGTKGFDNGNAMDATFYNPSGVAVDKSGNVYVADTWNHSIRKITPGGEVTTLAGSGTKGSDNGNGMDTTFNSPAGIAVDDQGVIYVADTDNHKIRKITPTGEVTTLAGSGTKGFKDGKGTVASFDLPNGVAVDAEGAVYVADSRNNKIRKITAEGMVSTLAGEEDHIGMPFDIVVDASGNLYTVCYKPNEVIKITHTGEVITFAGPGSNGTGKKAHFGWLWGIALDRQGAVYVSDSDNHKVIKISIISEE